MTEIWKSTHQEGYEVSDLGNVRSLDRKVVYSDGRVYYYLGKLLISKIDKNGYESINLSRNGRFRVHRLVLESFVPVHDLLKDEVNHIDGDKLNNKLSNLEWVSSSENKQHAFANGLRKTISCLEGFEVLIIRDMLSDGVSGVSLAKMFGVSTATISKIKNNKGVFK